MGGMYLSEAMGKRSPPSAKIPFMIAHSAPRQQGHRQQHQNTVHAVHNRRASCELCAAAARCRPEVHALPAADCACMRRAKLATQQRSAPGSGPHARAARAASRAPNVGRPIGSARIRAQICSGRRATTPGSGERAMRQAARGHVDAPWRAAAELGRRTRARGACQRDKNSDARRYLRRVRVMLVTLRNHPCASDAPLAAAASRVRRPVRGTLRRASRRAGRAREMH